jgi:hypothetical protein
MTRTGSSHDRVAMCDPNCMARRLNSWLRNAQGEEARQGRMPCQPLACPPTRIVAHKAPDPAVGLTEVRGGTADRSVRVYLWV